MTNTSISFADATLAYEVQGVGESVVLLFHGFGQDRSIFRGFPPQTLSDHRIFTFDILFHGDSKWEKGDSPIEKKDWKAMLQQFFEREGVTRFVVGGFSIGSRFALATFEMFPERVESIILMAPDAVVSDFWFRTATSNPISRSIFKSMIVKISPFLKLLNTIERFGFISSSLRKFAAAQMDSEQKRAQVYFTWVVLRKLSFNKQMLSRKLNDHRISVQFFVGKFDKVITLTAIQSFLKRLKYTNITVLETGHMGVVKACLSVMLQPIKSDHPH